MILGPSLSLLLDQRCQTLAFKSCFPASFILCSKTPESNQMYPVASHHLLNHVPFISVRKEGKTLKPE